MQLAAIDIGTNSIHMIVVRVRADFSFEVVDREKDMVRLGAGGLDGRALTPEAMHAALQVLSKFKRLADSRQVEHIIAAATSAVREAENGGEFLKAIVEQTGIRAHVISGTEEARLIHLAAVYGLGLSGETAVAVDIGGGSVEITRGAGSTIESGRSFKLGVIRLTERFVHSDPISARDERKMVRHIESELGEYLKQLARAGFNRVVGTSGTILSLGAVAATEQAGATTTSLRNRRIPAKYLHRVRKLLTSIDLEKRLQVPGLDPRRGDLAVAGAILIDTILRRLGADHITLCDLSLREGLILDYIARHRKEIAQADRYPDVRRRSVIELAERCKYSPEHSQQIAKLALALFDRTRGIHGLTDREREWLEYAALLHDTGVHISYEKHHRHSYYLIKHGDLRGFEPNEIELIALVARYHRRAVPNVHHEGYGDMSKKRRRIVRALAAMLRLAETLDRSHAQTITGLEFHDRRDNAVLRVRTSSDAELELWAASRHAGPLERILGKPLRIEVSREIRAEQSDEASRTPWHAVRRGGDRRGKKDAPAQPAGDAANRHKAPRAHHRMELVASRHGNDQRRKHDDLADAQNVQPAARHRLRR
ncbi:MAG: Ppx/GppA family phosphatase [Acidobacteriaceae bacterium]|jgi:exopolyphosphatase/guanosine-5'-triphosphate,3'-diphosphate pyrophosphatase|nr:Ppx/GppA family phosphatase [Acidobacteriaceae bacterium]